LDFPLSLDSKIKVFPILVRKGGVSIGTLIHTYVAREKHIGYPHWKCILASREMHRIDW